MTNIPVWKFDCVRAAIPDALEDGPRPQSEVQAQVGDRLGADERAKLGSLGWHFTVVKLELEVRGDVRGVPGKGPLVIAKAEE